MSTDDLTSRLALSPPGSAGEPAARPSVQQRPLVLAAVALGTVLTTHLVNFASGRSRMRLLDASSSASWSHMLTAGILVLSALVAVVGLGRARGQRGTHASIAASLALLAVAEISPFHVNVDRLTWGKLVYVPLLVVLSLCLWRVSAGSERGFVARAGLATLLLSFAIHVFGPHVLQALGWETGSWAYQVKVGLKQGTELAGWLLILLSMPALVGGFSRSP